MNRFYVTLTWHDWPEGGSYGAIVEAKNPDEAEKLARAEMRATYLSNYPEVDDDFLDERDMNWHLVDCFDIDDFIQQHKR